MLHAHACICNDVQNELSSMTRILTNCVQGWCVEACENDKTVWLTEWKNVSVCVCVCVCVCGINI